MNHGCAAGRSFGGWSSTPTRRRTSIVYSLLQYQPGILRGNPPVLVHVQVQVFLALPHRHLQGRQGILDAGTLIPGVVPRLPGFNGNQSVLECDSQAGGCQVGNEGFSKAEGG